MNRLLCVFLICFLTLAGTRPSFGEDAKQNKKTNLDKSDPVDPNNLPITKLAPAIRFHNLCLLKYPVTTRSPECQAFFDQGLGYFYSYVWMEAARSFEMATKYDPDCAMAWWGLSRAIEKWGKGDQSVALKKAQEMLPKASHREQLLITARLQEKGLIKAIAAENRKKEAIKTLDECLTLYDDDQEAWFARAQIAEGPNAAVPFYKALLRINPLHPGANHELVHHYENIHRPALGWPHAVKYIQSSPGIPHAYHMQAHLGMRIGKWDKTTEWSVHAVDLEQAYHKIQNVKPADDFQFNHHLSVLMTALIHDGRFTEAHKLKKLCEDLKIEHHMLWYRLNLAERDYDAALKIAAHFAKKDKLTGAYLRALVYLDKGETDRAIPEVNILREGYQSKRADKELELRLWETQGILSCRQQGADGGLKLLAKAVDKTKGDYGYHGWGHGAYLMEIWGEAALKAGRLDVAEEAFLEALAHDWGSVRGALGMQVLCERQGRTEEAQRFAELAARCWRRADPGSLQIELADLRGEKAAAIVRHGAN